MSPSMNNLDAINIAFVKSSVPETGTIEERLLTTMRAARKEVWLTNDEESLFRAAIGAFMLSVGKDSEEWNRVAHELEGIKLLNAGLVVGNLDAAMAHHEDGPAPIGLLKLWAKTKDPQAQAKDER